MKKIIGIPGYKQGDNAFGVANTYLEFASKFGNPRIIMPWEEFVKVDLLILPGGLDMAPSNYDEVPGFQTSNQDVFKEFFFHSRLKNYIGKVPIFGICLGFQQLAVYFKSKLTQDLLSHEQSPSRWAIAHDVYPVVRGQVKIEEKLAVEVNSHHHQALMLDAISSDLEALYVAEGSFEDKMFNRGGDFIVEAFRHKSLPIAGVQWHPEECYDLVSTRLIKQLLSSPEIMITSRKQNAASV